MRKHFRSAVISRACLVALAALLYTACGTREQAEIQRKAPNVANEAAAVRSLQTIFRAETQYTATHPGSYATLDDLVKDGSLDQRFGGASPVVEGYVFTLRLTQDAGGQSSTFAVNADPKEAGASGARHLYMDSASNVVRANAGRAATAGDPPLQ